MALWSSGLHNDTLLSPRVGELCFKSKDYGFVCVYVQVGIGKMASKHTFVVLPLTSELLSDPSTILPAIYGAALHSAASCTIIFSSPSPFGSSSSNSNSKSNDENDQLYTELRKSPRPNWTAFQTFLGKVYATLAAGQWRAGKVLMDVEVHFQGEQGDWGDKLIYTKEVDKRLIVLEGKSFRCFA